MNRFVMTATLLGCVGLTALADAKPPEQRREDKREARPERKEGRGERRDEQRHKPGPPPAGAVVVAPAATSTVAVAPPATTSKRPNSPRAREHFLEKQQQARQGRKQAQTDSKAWNATRTQRAESHRTDVAQTWGSVTNHPDAQAELSLHADRMARLNRALDLAEAKGDTNQANQINDLINKEISRHANVMASIQAKAGTP